MKYRVVTVYNHNVILARDHHTDHYVMIISKGIGFGVSAGEIVNLSPNDEQKIFYVIEKKPDVGEMKKINPDLEPLKKAVKEIVSIVNVKYGIRDSNLYDALLDHLSFTIQRINLGISTENPFVGEIQILYRQEMEIANVAAQVLYKYMGIEISEQEKGFIALHIYSARKQRPVGTAVKRTRVYSQILESIGDHFNKNINRHSNPCNSFLLNLDWLVRMSTENKVAQINLIEEVKEKMGEYYQAANHIAGVIEKEFNVSVNKNNIIFLAMDICRLIQTI